MTQERSITVASGWSMLFVNLAVLLGSVAMFIYGVAQADESHGQSGVGLVILAPIIGQAARECAVHEPMSPNIVR